MSSLHVLSYPHTKTNGEYSTCAYTTKVERFCRMMTGGDRRVILYSPEGNTAPCDEHVQVVSDRQQLHWFGEPDLNDLDRGGFDWNPVSPWWSEMNARTIGQIAERMQPDDIICVAQGRCQQIVLDALPGLIGAEFGVGYEGIILDRAGSPVFCAYESHAFRHLLYGIQGWRRGREYDTVIPNFFDPAEFPHQPHTGDYLLFVGRLIGQKGVVTAALVAGALGMKLKVAGPGAVAWGDGFVEYPEGRAEAPGLEYVGPVGIEARAELMADAAVTLVPTVYVEPFGGVAVESMIAGTPVVTTDFGAFTETVVEGVSGYRFQTLQEAVDLTEQAIGLDPDTVRAYAVGRYSIDAVKPMYDRWFGNLDGLHGEGWPALRERVA